MIIKSIFTCLRFKDGLAMYIIIVYEFDNSRAHLDKLVIFTLTLALVVSVCVFSWIEVELYICAFQVELKRNLPLPRRRLVDLNQVFTFCGYKTVVNLINWVFK